VIGIVSSPNVATPHQLSTTGLPMPHYYILWPPREISLSLKKHIAERILDRAINNLLNNPIHTEKDFGQDARVF